MSRQRLSDDIAAHICWRYLHGGFNANTNVAIHNIVHDILPNKHHAITMIYEIAYRIGYAKSYLMEAMSEVTYKKKKKLIRDKLALFFKNERNKNETS